MSRFNTLLHGSPEDVIELIDSSVDPDDVRVALCNALARIEQLEKQVANLRKDINE